MTVLTGVVAPITSDGSDGDLWINTVNFRLYGPKATTWPATYKELAGPAFLSGEGAPTTQGVDGDMYLDTVTDRLYGPKLATWPAYITLGAGVSVYSDTAGFHRITVRRDIATAWHNENPILAKGEFGFESDTGLIKIGTGLVAWQVLPYINDPGRDFPPGGGTGQVLAKLSNADYDRAWLTLTGMGTVNTVDVSGGTTGLTASGGPITAGGTITLDGILEIANGGNGTDAPALVAGKNVSVSGSWPDQHINACPPIQKAVGDQTTPVTAGTNKLKFRMPYAMTLTGVRISLGIAQATGSIFTVDINLNGTSVLSTKLTVDNTEKTSTTAATPAVISTTALADDAEIEIDVDQVGTSSVAAGLVVTLIGT